MAGKAEMMTVLDRCEAQFIRQRNGHLIYQLPNGKQITFASTPSDHRSYNNAISMVLRELRTTHPHLAMDRPGRSGTLPKHKRGATLGELLEAKKSNLPTVAGEVECVIEQLDPINIPDPSPYHPARNPRKEQAPRASTARTLSPEQLAKANDIMHASGQAAMNRYLEECRNNLVPISKELQQEKDRQYRQAHPDDYFNFQQGVAMLTDMMEMAKAELAATQRRIEENRTKLTALQHEIEVDESKLIKLDDGLKMFEKFSNEAAEILPLISTQKPPKKSEPVLISSKKKGPNTGRKMADRVKTSEIDSIILPALAAAGNFDNKSFYAKLQEKFPGRPLPAPQSIPPMLNTLKRLDKIERLSIGVYRVKASALRDAERAS